MSNLKHKPVIGTQVEFQQISTTAECFVCLSQQDVSYVITPCGHDGICKKCLEALISSKMPCPLCGKLIDSFIRIYTTRQAKVERRYVLRDPQNDSDRKMLLGSGQRDQHQF